MIFIIMIISILNKRIKAKAKTRIVIMMRIMRMKMKIMEAKLIVKIKIFRREVKMVNSMKNIMRIMIMMKIGQILKIKIEKIIFQKKEMMQKMKISKIII